MIVFMFYCNVVYTAKVLVRLVVPETIRFLLTLIKNQAIMLSKYPDDISLIKYNNTTFVRETCLEIILTYFAVKVQWNVEIFTTGT